MTETHVTLAIDIGGTFTDVVLRDADGRLWRHKLSTTAGDEAEAVVAGARRILEDAGVSSQEVTRIVHGSTIGTNSILERSGPRVGLVTTEGFRDVLEIARIRTPTLYNLAWRKPEPLVLRRHRYEIRERTDAGGNVVVPVDEGTVDKAIERLRQASITAVAVCFINAPANGANERFVAEYFSEHYPEADLSLSSDVLCELKEYERTSTTVINAYLRPVMRRYLGRLRERLRDAGLTASLHVMRSDGGMMSAEAVCDKPIFSVVSGPAAGVIAAQAVAEGSGRRDVLSFDMGGTTAKAAIVEDGAVSTVNEYEIRDGISTPSRFIKAGGYLLMAPSIDLAEVGNGAGSLARVDVGGALRVGPASAGAVPGPACYGRGSLEPTITDANVVLGYLPQGALLAGALPISRDLAEEAIRTRIAEPMGLGLVEAAWGIHVVANSNMMRAIRAVTVERGRDPRSYALVAFGGSGPVHAAAVAREMRMTEVIVPGLAGLLSAVGLLHAEIAHQVSRAWLRRLSSITLDELHSELLTLMSDANLAFEAHEREDLEARTFADLRYAGQTTTVTVEVANANGAKLEQLVVDFEEEYARTYRHRLANEPVEIVTLRAILTSPAPPQQRHLDPEDEAVPPSKGRRSAYFGPTDGSVEVPVLARADLRDSPITGPALVEEYDTTIVLPPRTTATLTSRGDVLIGVAHE